MVKQMWNLRHTAQQFAIEVLRPFTLVAQIRHWRGTGERLWFSIGQLLSAWRHQASYLRQHRHLRRRGRQVKKELLEEQLQQAWEADQHGDKSSIWKVVNRLAPRTARVKIQLRGKQGNLLTPTEEAERFRTYCEHIYKLPSTQPSSTTVEPSSVSTLPPMIVPTSASSQVHSQATMPLDTPLTNSPHSQPTLGPLGVPHLAEALSLLPARKATPPHLAQLHLWHLGKDVLLHISPRSANNSGSPLMTSINSGRTLGSHGSQSPAKPRTSQKIYGLFPSLKEEVASSSKRSLSSYVRPSLRRRQSWPQHAYVPDVALNMQSYVLCITVIVFTPPSRRSGSLFRRDAPRDASPLRVGVVSHCPSTRVRPLTRSIEAFLSTNSRRPVYRSRSSPLSCPCITTSGIGRQAPSQMSGSLAREA